MEALGSSSKRRPKTQTESVLKSSQETMGAVKALVESALLEQEFLARTQTSLGNETPTLDWLPSRILSSYSRLRPLHFVYQLVEAIRARTLPQPHECATLLTYHYVSLERNEMQQWEYTNVGRLIVLRNWYFLWTDHFMSTFLEWSAHKKRTFQEWHELFLDILSLGIPLADSLTLSNVVALVDSFRPRAKHATKVLHVLLCHYQHDPLPLVKQLLKLNCALFLNAFAARPDWLVWKGSNSLVKSIVAHMISNNDTRSILQLEILVGYCATGRYWPDNVLPDMLCDDDLSTECTVRNGIYVIDFWHVDLEKYNVAQQGQSAMLPIDRPIMQALLASNIQVLSGWSSDHDPPQDQGRSIGLYMLDNLQSMVHLWANHYVLSRRVRSFWVKTLLSLSGSIRPNTRHLWENLLLLAVFDRSSVIFQDIDEKREMTKTTMQLLQSIMGHVGPRVYVAILGAIMSEYEALDATAQWIKMSAPSIQWQEAIDCFAQKEWDRWSFLRQTVLRIRFGKVASGLARSMGESHTLPVPILYPTVNNGDFAWTFCQNPWRFHSKNSIHFLPVGSSLCLYRHRTLWQSLSIMASVLARQNVFCDKTLCLYSEQHGLAVEKNQVMRGTLQVGNRVLGHVSVKLVQAFLLRVSDNWSRRVASHGGIFANELALAVATSEDAKCQDLLCHEDNCKQTSEESVDTSSSVKWLHYNMANSVALDLAEDCRRASDHSETALIQDDVEHCMLATVWEDENRHMLCSWAMVAPARSEGVATIRSTGSRQEAMRDVFEREPQGDAFCGPVVTSQWLNRKKLSTPLVPIAWHARQSYTDHSVQLWFEKP